jgi:hypothetical protein
MLAILTVATLHYVNRQFAVGKQHQEVLILRVLDFLPARSVVNRAIQWKILSPIPEFFWLPPELWSRTRVYTGGKSTNDDAR